MSCFGCASLPFLTAGTVVTDAVFIEPGWIEVSQLKVENANYPDDSPPLTIAQMADFHRGPYMKDNDIKKAVDLCNSLAPDLIALTGDFISRSHTNAKPCAEVLSELRAKLGVYAVLGNHDYWEGAEVMANELTRNGITVLTNKNVKLMKNVWLIGLDDSWAGKPNPEKAFAGVPVNAVRIVMAHSPMIFPKINDRNCVVMTAHTHGGQANIPGVPRNKLPGLLGWKYIDGWYEENNSRMYVNRGIGMITPPIRFLCRPEITLYEFSK